MRPALEREPSYDVMLGYACNVECRFCSQELSWRKDGWLPLTAARERVFAAYQRGARILNILGGEATIYPDIVPLVAFARRAGYKTIQFETNGIKLSDRAFAQGLVRAGLTRASFSVHGHTAELHDRLVRKAGAFERLCAGMDHLKGLGVAVRMAVVVSRPNAAHLEDFCRRFLVEKGVREFQFIYPLYTGDFLNYERELALPLAEAAAAIEKAMRFLDESGAGPAIAHNVPPCFLSERLDRIGDWQDVGMEVLKPDGRERRDTPEEPLYRKAYARTCGKCRLRASCVGIDPAYLRRWGESGIEPLTAKK